MSKLTIDNLEEYLSSVYKAQVKVSLLFPLGKEKPFQARKDLKGFGYGIPYVIEFSVDGKTQRIVLETLRSDGFGHDHFSDRAKMLLWQHSVFNRLPRHVRSVDVGAFSTSGERLKSLGDCGEFFIITKFVDGKLYHVDLEFIMETGQLNRLDERRCLALSDYLVRIHNVKLEAPQLYVRRIRELVGDGECIMGLLDSYPLKLGFVDESYLIGIEKDCVLWRWRLKRKTHRISEVHGDFHPWNVMFHDDVDFTVLDRSRGEWGEPADDVAAMTINYLFFSLQKYGELTGIFERLFKIFWNNYLQKTNDREILEVIQPYYAWRGLVIASPVWYPNLRIDVRVKLLNFVKNILQFEHFDLGQLNSYITKA